MRKNIIIDTDFYKPASHWQSYKPGLTNLYAYGESRVNSKYPTLSWFGMQGIVAEHFLQPITKEMIDEAEEEIYLTGGYKSYFNKEVWQKVMKLGYLPIEIKTAPEGMNISTGNVLFTIESTKDWFADTVNTLESTMMHSWYPSTVATRAINIKNAIRPYFEQSCDNPEAALLFAVNDFGYRGATGHESAARGGAGFLLHFMGSDNLPANRFIKDYYGYKGRIKSVWATEHSTALSFGPGKGELEYLLHQLHKAPDDAIISIVIDTYDSDNFMKEIACHEEVIPLIKAREGRVVFRPDSGNALRNIVKYSEILSATYGFHINNKDFKVLNHNVGLIQGDGMDEESILQLYKDYLSTGWSAENLVTGSGGGLLQVGLNRDTQRFAVKPSYGKIGGEIVNMSKNPKTDPSKASKAGHLKLHTPDMTLQSVKLTKSEFDGYNDLLRTLYKDGEFYPDSFESILKRVNENNVSLSM